MAGMSDDQEPQAEIVIHYPTSKDGHVGWSVRLVRKPAIHERRTADDSISIRSENDAEYTARVLAKHRELERELLTRVCCHDADACAQVVKEGARE